jgi:hypothetical protein
VKICFRTQRDSPAFASLRERTEDVFMLTRHFLQQSAKQLGVEPKRISDAAAAQQLRVPAMRQLRTLPLAVGDGARRWWSPGPAPRCWNVPEALRLAAARTAMPVLCRCVCGHASTCCAGGSGCACALVGSGTLVWNRACH